LTRNTYGFDFEQWYNDGYWQERYIPYSLCLIEGDNMDGESIVSNVSVNIIDFIIKDKTKRFIQIGTVMTDIKYRKLGLCGYLITRVINEWKDKYDMLYLFANDSVLDFYPKFGFIKANEYQYTKTVIKKPTATAVVKLNMSVQSDRLLLIEKIKNSLSFARISMYNNINLIMFYCTSFMKDNIYYIPEFDVIVIVEFDNEKMFLYDIFCSKTVSLDIIINILINKETKKVLFGFTPEVAGNCEVELLQEKDTTLFIYKNSVDIDLFYNDQLMFAALSHT
jgi:hypothetical protein